MYYLPDGIEDTEHECQKCKDVELIALSGMVLTLCRGRSLPSLTSLSSIGGGEEDDLRLRIVFLLLRLLA